MKAGQIRSEYDRSASTIIIICMTIIAVGCILGMSYLFEYNFYEAGDEGKTAKSVAVQIYSSNDTELAIDYYNCSVSDNDQYRLNYYKDNRFLPQNTNFVFTVTDSFGNLEFDSTEGTDISFEEVCQNNDFIGTSNFFSTDENGSIIPLQLNYAIITGENQIANDKYAHAFRWIDAANALRYFIIAVLLVAVLIVIVLLSVMTANAGVKDDEKGDIVPGFFDKIPLDVLTVFLILLFVVAWIVIGLTSAADVEMVLNNVVIMITCVAAVLVIMTYLTTLSVRVKMGKIYKNTVFYRIYRKFKRKTPRSIRRKAGEMTAFRKLIIGIVVFFLSEAAILSLVAYFGILDKSSNPSSVLLTFIITWGITRLIIIPIFAMIAINLYYVKEEGQRLAEGVLGDEISSKLTISSIRAHGRNLDQIKKEINKAVEQELKSERLRNELITNVSHDIKTPLTSIKSYVDFLQNGNLSEKERKDYLEIVAKNTDKLTVLAKNLIEVSQITSGNIEVKSEKTNLNIIIEQTIEEFAFKFDNNELIPRISLPENDIFIMGDGEWLWRIFSNLLNNACKYAARGTDVEISLDESDGKAHIRISNISNSALNVEGDELFERFVRGDSSRHTEGNGLGLSIARSLAEHQGGTLDVSVKDEKFTAFLIFDSVK